MALFNYATKEVTLKIVYYGPGLSGKTTNLQYLHSSIDPSKRGKLLSLATEADRTLFFDFMPVELGKVKDFSIRFQLYTVPGQVRYNATRKLVLKGADAVVFVADSQRGMLKDNIESLENMYENLKANNIDPEEIPIVLQYNKRDLSDIMSVEELNTHLNKKGYPYFEAVAIEGKGVNETFQAVVKLLLKQLAEKYKIGVQPEKEQKTEPVAKATELKEPLPEESVTKEEIISEQPEEVTLAEEDVTAATAHQQNSISEPAPSEDATSKFQSSLKEPIFEEDLSIKKDDTENIEHFSEENADTGISNWLETAEHIEKEEPLITEEKVPEHKTFQRDFLLDEKQKDTTEAFEDKGPQVSEDRGFLDSMNQFSSVSEDSLEEIRETLDELKQMLMRLKTHRESSVHIRVSIEKITRTLETIQENQQQILNVLNEIQEAIKKAKQKKRWLRFR